MNRKMISLLCVIALLVSLLSACGGQPAADNPNAATNAATNAAQDTTNTGDQGGDSAEAEPSNLEYVELDWFTMEMNNYPDYNMIVDELNAYLLEKLNMKVNVTSVSTSEYGEKIKTMLQAGEEIGIAHLNNDYNYYSAARQGLLYPVDELWDEYGIGTKALFSEDVWASITVDNHIYGVPSLKDNAYIMGYIYNGALADELGVNMDDDSIDTIRDLEDVLMQAYAKRNELHPEWADKPLCTELPIMTVPSAFSVECFLGISDAFAVCNVPGIDDIAGYDKDTVFNLYATEEYKEFCLMMQRLVDAGVCAYDYTELTNLGYEPYCLYNGAGWGYTWIDENMFGEEVTAKLHTYEDNIWTDSSNFVTAGYVIPANCPDPERAMMFIELMNTDPYVATLMRFGVEGEHYIIDEAGNMTMEGSPRNSDPSNLGYLQWYGAGYGNMTIINAPATYVGPNNEMFTAILEYNNSAKLAAHMGLVVDTSSVTNEVAACSSVVQEFDYNLMMGKYDSQEAVVEAWEEFNAKLEANGVDKVIAEVQAQVDAFNAQN